MGAFEDRKGGFDYTDSVGDVVSVDCIDGELQIMAIDAGIVPADIPEFIERVRKLAGIGDVEKHIHVNSGDGTDVCAKCGRDLRDSVHLREGES